MKLDRDIEFWGDLLQLNKLNFRDINDLTKGIWLGEIYVITNEL